MDTGEEIASLAGRFEPVTFAEHAIAVAKWYHSAPIMVERNNHGHTVLAMLREHAPELTRLCGDDGKPGWNTTVKSKVRLYDLTGESLRDGDTVIHGLETFSQLASIEGSTQRAPEGQLDDRATAFALALAGRVRALLLGAATVAEGPMMLTTGWQDPLASPGGPSW